MISGQMNNVYIAGGLRSYIGLKNGIYKHISAEMLGAELLKELILRYSLNNTDKIICGNAVGAGGNITRLMSLSAGLDIPAVTIDSQCTSGLEAVKYAAAEIASGFADCIICGGFESASTQPIREYNPNHPDYASRNGNTHYMTAKFSPGEHCDDVMLKAAENTSMYFNISREDTYPFILNSHSKAAEARDKKLLDSIIYPYYNACADEGIRDRMNIKLLNRLHPVLPNGEYITAASSCLINDGAAFLILCSEEYLTEHRLKPLAKIIGFSEVTVEPELSPYAAVKVCRSLCERYGITSECYEVNEAFAVIDVLMQQSFKDMSGYNIFGGALAYGHPYGASGAIILLHLLRSLEYMGRRYGTAAAAAAGGLGCGILIERTVS